MEFWPQDRIPKVGEILRELRQYKSLLDILLSKQ